ncbi:unnamed protein product [Calypogeia fissa]
MNPALTTLPGLSYDLSLVEKAVETTSSSMQCASLPFHPSSPEQDHRTGIGAAREDTRSWIPPKWCLPAMSYSSGHSAGSNDTREEGMGDGSSLQLETLHEWGSDLELASPRMFDACILGSSWTTNLTGVPFSALMSAPSPTSSLVSNHKAGCSSWSSANPNLGLNSLGAFDYALESSSSQSNMAHGRLPTYRELAHPGGKLSSCHSESILVGANGPVGQKMRGTGPPRKGVERTRSHCSDESVCTPPIGSERQPSVFSLHSLTPHSTKLSLSDCSNEMSPQETSSQLTEPCFSRKEGVTTRNMLEKVSGGTNHHQRGPTERMTEITLSELSNYFNMPITQASKELKVGLTVLKKRCREFGIPRWPHRKMKSLDSLIHNIQELAKGPEGKTSAPVMNAVKELEHQKKRMEERPGIELAERTKRLRQACFKASYKKRRQAQTLAQQESYEVSGAVPVDQCVSTLVS